MTKIFKPNSIKDKGLGPNGPFCFAAPGYFVVKFMEIEDGRLESLGF